MHLFRGGSFSFKKAVFTKWMRLIVLPADSPPHFPVMDLLGFRATAVTVVVSVFYYFVLGTILAAVHSKFWAAGMPTRSARFSQHGFHLAFIKKGKTHTIVRMSLTFFILQLYSTKNKPSYVVAKCCKACMNQMIIGLSGRTRWRIAALCHL